MACKYVTYLRVSTQKQGASGLGEEAQRTTVQSYAAMNGCSVIAEYVEIESGRKSDKKRPQLAAAIDRVQQTGATLLIARLDRLTRSVSFLSKLRDAKVRFLCCDFPEANKLTINIMASVAEYEAERIAENTMKALAEAKKRGPKEDKKPIGNPMGIRAFDPSLLNPEVQGPPALPFYRAMGRAAHRAKTEAHAVKLAKTFKEIQAQGITTLKGIADALNERQILTTDREPLPGDTRKWRVSSVARLKSRIDRLPQSAAQA